MKIYMDVCCFNRPFDDQTQTRIRLEAEAILSILSRCQNGEWSLAASDVIDYELSNLTNEEKLEKVRSLYSVARNRAELTQQARVNAAVYQQNGIDPFDSLHLAVAESSNQNILLTTDDKFLRKASAIDLKIAVANPVTWLMEVLK